VRKLGAIAVPVVVALLAGCGGGEGTGGGSAAGTTTAVSATPVCPAAWKAGWQRLADRIAAPVYCPSWLPRPLDGKLGGRTFNGRFVDPDRSYLVSFVWMEASGGAVEEVHVNFRGYPGATRIPTCEDTLTVDGKTVHPKIPCFSDARGQKRFGDARVTVYTANQGVDQWHVLYAWRHDGTLYTVSQHVAAPNTYTQVVAALDRMMRGLVLLQPST
jgi:hypothetical protein